MDKTQKTAQIEELKQLLSEVEAVILADTSGVDVNSINELRSAFRKEDVTFKVIKNTLARKAVVGTDFEEMADSFKGPTAIAVKAGDPVTPAKIAVNFAKEHPKFEIKGGYMNQHLDVAGVEALSKMKGLEELRAELLSIFKAPQQNLVGICNTMVTQFLGLLNARADEMEKAA